MLKKNEKYLKKGLTFLHRKNYDHQIAY